MTAAEFARLPVEPAQRRELFAGQLQVSGATPECRAIIAALQAALQAALAEEYSVVAGARFRLAPDTIVEPGLAVVPREAYRRCLSGPPDYPIWLEMAPILAVLVPAPGTPADILARSFSAYRDCGTEEVWIVSASTRSVSRFTNLSSERSSEMYFDSIPLPRSLPRAEIAVQSLFAGV